VKPKFLIYISEAYGIPIGMPLKYEILNQELEVAWFIELESSKKLVPETENILHSVKEVKAFKPNVVLVASNDVPDFFPGIKVQIFHGFSVSKRSDKKGHFRIRGFFDLYCTQGPSTTLPFLKLKEKHKYFDVIETGWPKVDLLFPLKEINKNQKPTIIISSTFTTRLSLAKNESVFNEIKRLSKLGKWHFISILHPKIEAEIVKKFKSLENKNFKFYNTIDLVPLFKKADVMLSDTTSAITEFVLQEKPVVTINNNKPQNYMINITETNEIEDAINYALTKPDVIINNIKFFILKTHPYRDGKSSKRVIDACLFYLKNNKVKRKPLNLIRKYKIRKKLRYYKLF